jgi:AraC family transcriptional regulator
LEGQVGKADMQLVARALWFIESHFAGPVGLADVADCAGASRHHLSRTFHRATGRSLSAYLRGRRLTEAARSLAGGAPDILAVAVEAQYGSHEAFTRAFREQFGVTPETVRRTADLASLPTVEPLRMQTDQTELSAPPRFVDAPAQRIAGIEETYSHGGAAGIPGQWQRLLSHLGSIPGQKGRVAYAVVNFEGDTYRYLTGVEVERGAELPSGFKAVDIPAQTYAVFRHDGHVSTIQTTCGHADQWLPKSGFEHSGPIGFIERYGEGFDPQRGRGDIEVWVPIAPKARP